MLALYRIVELSAGSVHIDGYVCSFFWSTRSLTAGSQSGYIEDWAARLAVQDLYYTAGRKLFAS